MPDRPNSESKFEYQELIAGHSPHKGQVFPATPTPSDTNETLDTKVDPYQDPTFHQPLPVSEIPAPMAKVRGRVSQWIKKLLK